MLTSCNNASATKAPEIDFSLEDPVSVFQDLQTIIAEGFHLHASYNFSTIEGRHLCIEKKSHLADETKELQERVDRVSADHKAQRDLFLAAHKALSCVYCGGDPIACGQASEHMNKARQVLLVHN